MSLTNNYDIKIDNFYFRILNKNTTKYKNDPKLFKHYRPIVNICSSTNKDFTENLLKFSVYLSNSDLGCFRLCYRYNEQQVFSKGNDDYIQSSFIHIKLQEFIHEIFNNLKESNDYFCLEEFALNQQDMIEIGNHISDTKRIIRRKPFKDNNLYKCGHDINYKFEDINKNLNKFSEELKLLYIYSNNELISNIIINDDENVYNMQFYKVNLELQIPNYKTQKLKKTDYVNEDNIDNIILYYCNAKITKFMTHQFEEPIYINLPVFLTTKEGEKITKFGTFEKYILAGNYICKVFDYISQCAQGHIGECYGDYKLIGNRYNNIFPLSEINSRRNISWNYDLSDENIQIIKIEKKREIKKVIEEQIKIENKVKGIENKNWIKIDNLYFLVLNKNLTIDIERPIVNIYSSTNENFSENNNKFSVYLSKSDLGCFRLCLKFFSQTQNRYLDIYEKGVDYIQSSFIHIKLQEFIHKIFNNLEPSIDYFCSYIEIKTFEHINAIKLYDHIHETGRVIKKTPFIENNKYKCGDDYKQPSYYEVTENLKDFSKKLKSLYDYDYDYSNNKPISKVNINDSDNVYDLEFYKVKLKLKDQEQEYIDNIILYYCNSKITKFMGNKFEEPIYINLPVFLTTEEGEKITKFGTFEKYILAGNYICKVFDYINQCPNDHTGECIGDYKLIGEIYNNIFPLLEIREREEEESSRKLGLKLLEDDRRQQQEEESSRKLGLKLLEDDRRQQEEEREHQLTLQLLEKERREQEEKERREYQLTLQLLEKERREKERREYQLTLQLLEKERREKEEKERREQEESDREYALSLRYQQEGGIRIINDRCNATIKNINDSNCNQKLHKIQKIQNGRDELIEDMNKFFNKKINKKLNLTI
jgi:hypothetical protein